MHPAKTTWLHHLLQGGTWQSLRPTGDIQCVSGVWLYGSSFYRKQCMNACAGACPGSPPEKMGIRCSSTAKVHFDNGKVTAENLPGDSGKGFEVAMAIFKEDEIVQWLGSAARGGLESSGGCSGLSVPTSDSSTDFSWGQHCCGDGTGAFTRTCCHATCSCWKHLSSPSSSHTLIPQTMSQPHPLPAYTFLLHTFIDNESLRLIPQKHIWTFFLAQLALFHP